MISRNTNNNSGNVGRFLITCCGLILLTLSSAIVAQDEVGIEEVVVTAQRREQNLQDVPISISAFNADNVEAYMFNDVTDYLIRTPNAAWTSVGSKSRRELSIRGATNLLNINRGLRTSTFAFYQDDFSVNGSTGNPPVMDVERIEILRGPQATYFGRNALAGGLSVTSKKPHNDLAGVGDGGLFTFRHHRCRRCCEPAGRERRTGHARQHQILGIGWEYQEHQSRRWRQ